MRLRPDSLATLILATQHEAQAKAEAAVTEALDTFRADPRISAALDTLRDTQSNPQPQPHPTPTTPNDDEDYVDSVYNSDRTW